MRCGKTTVSAPLSDWPKTILGLEGALKEELVRARAIHAKGVVVRDYTQQTGMELQEKYKLTDTGFLSIRVPPAGTHAVLVQVSQTRGFA